MGHKAVGTIEMAALGRPFSLGMLYDCRHEKFIPGMTLWNYDDLVNHIGESPQQHNDFEIVASESIEDKSSALNVEGSLKASLFFGLIELEGSAKYLRDNRTFKNQARVTLKYEATTKFQELSMNHLGIKNVKYPDVFTKGIATHVVTAILYGAQAFFVFDREVSDMINREEAEGFLRGMIKKIPILEGDLSLKLEEKDFKKVEEFSCKFHGDFLLEKTPSTFQDAIQVYQSLPKLLGPNGENAVPVKVWLLPLTSLDPSATKLVYEISDGFVKKVQAVLEDFSELEIRCNDILRATEQQFPQIGKKIETFKEVCSEFRLEFQSNLAKKLPSIREGGEKKEAELTEILRKRDSPFNSKDLNKWMDCKEREISNLKSFTNMMKNTKIVPSQNHLYKETHSAEHAVCFVFTSLEYAEPFLSALSNYLKQTPKTNDTKDPHTDDVEREQWYTSLGSAEPFLSALSNYFTETPKPDEHRDPHTDDVEREQWYTSKEVLDAMSHKAKLFSDFAEANKENKNIKFLTVGSTNETQKGSSIYLYKDGFSVSENFEPPSKPETVTVTETNHNSVTLKISPPKFGAENITSYSVEYCVSGDDGWKQKTASEAEEVTVSDLSPNTEYMFRCRAVTSAGVGPANEVSGSIKTLPCSPPGKLQVEPTSSEISLSWEKPAELGQNVHILSYIVEYAKKDNSLKEEDLQWSQKMAGAERVIISGLQPETEYVVRVRCDCGEAGGSKESITVTVCTTKSTPLTDFLKSTSVKISSESPSVYKLPLDEEEMDIDGCRRFSCGKESMRKNCTIMLLGETGSGKSTLINAMINYIVGVDWEDNFRFKLIDEDQSRSQAESQTSEVTVYKINHQEGFEIPFSLTIVDTPGFGDARGIGRDKEITERIRRLFTSVNGVSEIVAVCFVTQASLARLNPTHRHVFDSVLSIFGNDVAENIQILVTFADGKLPPVLEAINVSGLSCPKNDTELPVHFKFNNSALFADNRSSSDRACDEDSDEDSDDNDDSFDEMFWNMGARSMEKFFTALGKMRTKSLLMTQEVLQEREQLETAIEGFQQQIIAALAQLEETESTEDQTEEPETATTFSESFEIEVEVLKPVKKQLTKEGEYITNCQKCSMTCHYPCMIADDNEKRRCESIDRTGMCTVCPGKCIWSVHVNQTYRWDYVQVKEKQTLQELKDECKQATKEQRQKTEITYTAHSCDMIVSVMDQSAHSVTRLQEVALRPKPVITPEDIDMLIEGEKSEAKEGYQARIQSLEEVQTYVKIMSMVNGFPLFDSDSDSEPSLGSVCESDSEENQEKCKFM